MSRPRNRGAARSGGAHAMNAASRGRLLRDEVVRVLHETGLTASALARLQWCTAMDPERLRVFAAKAGTRNLPESQWTAIVTILDELWHADAEVGHGTPDSYVVRFYASQVCDSNSARQAGRFLGAKTVGTGATATNDFVENLSGQRR